MACSTDLPDCAIAFALPSATICVEDAAAAILTENGQFLLDETGAILFVN